MMIAQKLTVGLATGREGKRKALGLPENPRDKPTLGYAGIDKNLADRARKAYAMPADDFEDLISEGRDDIRRSVERSADTPNDRRVGLEKPPRAAINLGDLETAQPRSRTAASPLTEEMPVNAGRKTAQRRVVTLNRKIVPSLILCLQGDAPDRPLLARAPPRARRAAIHPPRRRDSP
jgi:hypothetical protein